MHSEPHNNIGVSLAVSLTQTSWRGIFICRTCKSSGIHGDVNKPHPPAVAHGLGWFTAINPDNCTITIT